MRLLLLIGIVGLFFIVPLILTIINIVNVFKKKPIKENLIDALIVVLGSVFTSLLYYMEYSSKKDYFDSYTVIKYELSTESIPLHLPIASWGIETIIIFAIIALISYVILRIWKLELSPLAIVINMSGVLIGCILSFVWIIQFSKNLNIWSTSYLCLFPLNYIICSYRIIRELVSNYTSKEMKMHKNKFLNKCNVILNNSKNWPVIAFILILPIIMIILGILILLGQEPDNIIKAFTETSDWTLSKKVGAPPVFVEPTHDGHYLCTVALKGHEKLVKPLRYGIRHNHTIIVNRQLCIANAFEDLIQEKWPKFHKFVRYIYDKYGYPISKHINTAISADLIYLLMKPLEHIFLLFLYLFDKKPENRISVQYLPKIYKDFARNI